MRPKGATLPAGRLRRWLFGACAAALVGLLASVSSHADENPSNDVGSFKLRMTPRDAWPPVPVTDLEGLAGSEKQVLLQWTSPDENFGVARTGVGPSSYTIRYSTFGVEALGGDTTAWFNLAQPMSAPPGLPAGSMQSLLTTLEGGVTYYFGLRSTDDAGLVSDVDENTKGVSTQVRVPVKGVHGLTDLRAVQGSSLGAITLTWTQPDRIGAAEPLSYEMRVSTLANINGAGDFLAARPLGDFSPSTAPAVGAPRSAAVMTVTGLVPGVNYFFAARAVDSGAPAFSGPWYRDLAAGFNVFNSTRATFVEVPPNAVTDLAADEVNVGQAGLTWTVPQVPGGVPIVSYIVKASTVSIADFFGGDPAVWFSLAPSTTVIVTSSKTAGQLQSAFIQELAINTTVYFAVKAVDADGRVSAIDSLASGVSGQARVFLTNNIDLTAVPGGQSGAVALSWLEPPTNLLVAPFRYDIRASTTANFDDDAGFDAAAPLAAFSGSPLPVPGLAGQQKLFLVSGLATGVTHYFGIRLVDSDAPAGGTSWRRNLLRGISVDNFATPGFTPRDPDAITDLAAAPGTLEGEVTLSWTAPRNQNFSAIRDYTVRFATFSPAALGGDTTAWFDAATGSRLLSPAGRPGAAETFVIAGLAPYATYYFGIRSTDRFDEVSPADVRLAAGTPASSKPRNFAPATPSGLAAAAGRNKALLSWTDLSAAGKGLDFAAYRLYRSTEQASGYVAVGQSPAPSFISKPLTPYVTYFFKLSAVDQEGLESGLSVSASTTAFTLPPQTPFGFGVVSTSATARLDWSTTTKFADGDSFELPLAPTVDELAGYQVLRSTDLCVPFAVLQVKTATETSHVDLAGDASFYYVVRSFNSLGLSKDSQALDRFGTRIFRGDDCASRLILGSDMASELLGSGNSYGVNIAMQVTTLEEEIGGKVMQAIEFKPLAEGVTEMKGFHFSRPVDVVLHYVTDASGAPTPQTQALATPEAYRQKGAHVKSARTSAGSASEKDLGMFWNNGVEYKKLYGKVDTLNQVVAVKTPNLGRFQIRTIYRDGAVTFDISNITSRVFSPNGDGLNDAVTFLFDNPRASFVEGKVYDLRGAFVADMKPGFMADTLTWDGKMNGRVVTSGVYLYEIRAEGRIFNGTLVVAR